MSKQRETKHFNEWRKKMRQGGAITQRLNDLTVRSGMSNKRKFDGYVFAGEFVFPVEAKYKEGGKTFNLRTWREGKQSHQLANLCKFEALGDIYRPILIIFWKVNGRIKKKVAPAGKWMYKDERIELGLMSDIETFEQLVLFGECWVNDQDIPSQSGDSV